MEIITVIIGAIVAIIVAILYGSKKKDKVSVAKDSLLSDVIDEDKQEVKSNLEPTAPRKEDIEQQEREREESKLQTSE